MNPSTWQYRFYFDSFFQEAVFFTFRLAFAGGRKPKRTLQLYSADGDGKRVKKVVPSTGETTVFIYDASGKLVAEYSTIVETTNPKVSYLTADHLGSPRITTDENGQVISRRDFQPFGEEIATSQRTQGLGYAGDTVRQKFTSYERDSETELDFAQARYYNSMHARFTSADPIYKSKEHIANPQRWNLYVYVINNPLNLTDPDGQKPKREIDVFLAYGDKVSKEWKALRKEALKQGVKINFFVGKRANTENFIKSISTSGRTTVFVGHASTDEKSYAKHLQGGSLKGLGVGLGFADGVVGGGDLAPTKISEVDTKAKTVVVFSCDFSKMLNEWKSSTGTNLLYIDGGKDGSTGLETGDKAGLQVVESLVDGKSLENARKAGQKVYDEHQNVNCVGGGKCNQGDRVKIVKLPPKEEE